MEIRQICAARLIWLIDRDDIHAWLNVQLETIKELHL